MVQKNFPKPPSKPGGGMFAGMQRRIGTGKPPGIAAARVAGRATPVIKKIGAVRDTKGTMAGQVKADPAQALKAKAAQSVANKGLIKAASGPAGLRANAQSRVAAVAKGLSPTTPLSPRMKAARDKNSIGQTGSERAMIKRGLGR